MIDMTTFEENPPNSPEYVQELLEAKLDFGFSKVPPRMWCMINMWGAEKEAYGGVAGVKDILNEFLGIYRISPTVEEFEEYIFSPVLNHAKVFKVIESPTKPKKLKVKLYMGDGWEKDFPYLDGGKAPDLFAKLRIQGLLVGERKEKTEVKKNCWLPWWGEEFEFPLCSPDDFLRVDVYDHDRFTRNDFAGTVSLPVSELRMGTRAVPLVDQKGVQCNAARLVMRFMFV